jgi:hypothetical protein
MPLPNLWQLYGLRASPFFQETLGVTSERYPLSLFVGREEERQRVLAVIGGSGSSRQAIAGPPGIGKTTFVQSVKGAAVDAGYWALDDVVPLYVGDDVEGLIGRLLGAVYGAVIAARPRAAGSAVEAAGQLVRAQRLTGGGANLSILGVGGGVSRTRSVSTPPGAMQVDGPRLLRDLLEYARRHGAPGVLVHVNNLENLGERDARAAAELLRSIRDPILLLEGMHVILVGAGEVVHRVVGRYAQVRSIFSAPLTLGPLGLPELRALLDRRYAHLAHSPRKRAHAPVGNETLERLYPLFRGDLRAFLKVLEDGVTALLGVARATPPAPIAHDEIHDAIRTVTARQLRTNIGEVRYANLAVWARRNPEKAMTQADLQRLWGLTQGSVSVALRGLQDAGCVEALPRAAGKPAKWLLAGTARVALG